jgi:hypothetical protein
MDNYSFYYEKEVPNYLPCMYPLIHEYLKNNKCNSCLSVYANIEMMGLPVFSANKEQSIFRVNIRDTKKLGYGINEKSLGFRIKEEEYLDHEKGLEFITRKLENDRSVIVSGTQYYLPYSNNFMNLNYIRNYPNPLYGVANHWLLIYEIVNEKMLIRDATLNFVGNIGLNDFSLFWKGDKHINQLKSHPDIELLYQNGYVDIEINKSIPLIEYKNLLLSIIKTITYEFFKSQIIVEKSQYFYFGKLALEKISKCLKDIVSLVEPPKELLECFNSCLFNSKFNKYIFKRLLIDINDIFNGVYVEELSMYEELVNEWDNVVNIYSIYLLRNKLGIEALKSLLSKIESAFEKETRFMEMLNNKHFEVSLLK